MTEVLDNVKPNIEELHDAVMEVLDQDYIDFEYSFTKEEIGRASCRERV